MRIIDESGVLRERGKRSLWRSSLFFFWLIDEIPAQCRNNATEVCSEYQFGDILLQIGSVVQKYFGTMMFV
jgi:hypothetical protein